MKVAPVSADLLIKAGAVVMAVGGIAWAVYYLKTKAAAALSTTFNPLSTENVAYQTVNTWGGSLVDATGPGKNADGSWSLGGWLFDMTHPGTTAAITNLTN